MIVVGFPGIGKSTLASKHDHIIDLESSSFWKTDRNGDKTRPYDWCVYYVQIAEHLSKQGYTVFVSSHPEVRKYLEKHSTEKYIVIFPNTHLKDDWLKRLYQRYENTGLDKDLRAYKYMEKNYLNSVEELISECRNADNRNNYSGTIIINKIDYGLLDLLHKHKYGFSMKW